MSDPYVAILVLNRNMKEMTERLIDAIRKTTKVKHTLVCLEAASDKDQYVRTADETIVFSENKKWAWSFARGMELALYPDRGVVTDGGCWSGQYKWHPDVREWYGWKTHDGARPFTHFWLLCNDTQLNQDTDTLQILLNCMEPDAAQIHPYQYTHPVHSPQGRGHMAQPYHIVSFVEFVCPLITRSFYDGCVTKFGRPPINPNFAYGWGVDYEMAYLGHEMGLKSYICDAVGITHHPGTTHENHEKTKVEDNNTMRVRARNNMLDVLEAQYGRNWGGVFEASARKVGVDPKAFLEWSAFDRGLSDRGERVQEKQNDRASP